MNTRAVFALLCLVVLGHSSFAFGQKSYKHAAKYQVAVLDETIRLHTGADLTAGKNATDAKLDRGGQGIHYLHTDAGDYRVEAPVNKGATFLTALATPKYQTAPTVHNKWFLDNVKPQTQVLFASECAKPNKNHPHDVVRCTFYFPDPDSDNHEYATTGDFTPYVVGDGANTTKVANTLCGTGKLNPETEAKLCTAVQQPTAVSDPASK